MRFLFLGGSPVQPLSTFWCPTVRSTTMPAATSLQTVSCWLSSFPAASGGSQTRASWPSTLWPLTTWGRCSTPRDSVPPTGFSGAEKRKFLLMSSCVFLRSVAFLSAGPNAISVSLSPMGCYVMVGLASRRILLHPTTDHMVAQVFRLQQPHGGETSIRVSQTGRAVV